mgnify:CR=1 FL=1
MIYFIIAVIGIIAWQIICFVIYEISNENTTILEYMTMGVIAFITGFIWLLYRKIRFKWCQKHLNGYRFIDKVAGHQLGPYYMTDKQAQKLYSEGKNEYYIIKCSAGCSWKSAPYKGDIYRGQEVFHGNDMKKYWRK